MSGVKGGNLDVAVRKNMSDEMSRAVEGEQLERTLDASVARPPFAIGGWWPRWMTNRIIIPAHRSYASCLCLAGLPAQWKV